MTQTTRSILLDALEVAADARRDRNDNCRDCSDGDCDDCKYRTECAAEYDRVAGILQETYAVEIEAPPISSPEERARLRAALSWNAERNAGDDE